MYVPHHNLFERFSSVRREHPETKDNGSTLLLPWFRLFFGWDAPRQLVVECRTVLRRDGEWQAHFQARLREVRVEAAHEVITHDLHVVLRVDRADVVVGARTVEDVEAIGGVGRPASLS